jgi:hypothetical protein
MMHRLTVHVNRLPLNEEVNERLLFAFSVHKGTLVNRKEGKTP